MIPYKSTDRDTFKLVCENDFSFFAKQFLKVLEPETVFEWNWHLDALCRYCEKVYYSESYNLDINIPPRTLKSLIITVLFPCWIWTKNPSFKIMSASSSFGLSNSFNIKRRDIIKSDEYQSLWPIELKAHADRINYFENASNGFMRAVSAGGKVTGSGADLLISDDLLDAKEAFSTVVRKAVNQWYSTAYYNRVQNKKKAKRINVNQRLHKNDLSGHLRTEHNFERLIIPMQMTEETETTVDFIDPRSVGEYLHPARYSQKEKDDDYKSLGVYGWSSQMQQNPVPEGGGIIKTEWLRYYNQHINSFNKKIITADLNFKEGVTTDFACFQVWALKDNKKYLIDIIRGRWGYKKTKEMFVEFCNKHKDATMKYIEDKANGPALISDLSSAIVGLTPWPRKDSSYVKADKVQRLHLVSQEYEMGNVYLPENIELVEKFVEELISFTEQGSTTGNDDMVDTSTMALLELKTAKGFFAA